MMLGGVFFCIIFWSGMIYCSLEQYRELDEERVAVESRLHAWREELPAEVVQEIDAYESVMKRLLLLLKKRNRELGRIIFEQEKWQLSLKDTVVSVDIEIYEKMTK